MRNYRIDFQDALAWMTAKTPELIGTLSALVAHRSVSGVAQGIYPFGESCARVLEEALRLAQAGGLAGENHEYYCGTARLAGERDTEIGVFTHLDVVPEGADWENEPYSATVKDGLIIGRGVSDDKGPAAAALFALFYLREKRIPLRGSVRIFFGCNEEAGMRDIAYYIEKYGAPSFALVPDCEFPVCNAEKGITQWNLQTDISGGVIVDFAAGDAGNMVPNRASALVRLDFEALSAALAEAGSDVAAVKEGEYVRVSARGIGAHAAHPEHSLNAAAKLAASLAATGLLDAKSQKALSFIAQKFACCHGESFGISCEDEVSGRLTHIGGLTSLKDGKLTQNMNIRYPVTADFAKIEEGIRKTCAENGFVPSLERNSPPCHVNADTPAVRTLLDICEDCLGMEKPEPYSMGGGTYARHLPRAVGFGPGTRKPSPFGIERGREHQPDECIEIADLVRAAAVYAVAIAELDLLV